MRQTRRTTLLTAALLTLGCGERPAPTASDAAPPAVPPAVSDVLAGWGLPVSAVVEIDHRGIRVNGASVAAAPNGDAHARERHATPAPRFIERLGSHLDDLSRDTDAPLALAIDTETPFWHVSDAVYTISQFDRASTVAFVEIAPAGPGVSLVSPVLSRGMGPTSILRLGRTTVTGPCDGAAIGRTVDRDLRLLAQCTTHRSPAIGEARIDWVVDGAGRIVESRVTSAGSLPPEVGACWATLARGWLVMPAPGRSCAVEQRLIADAVPGDDGSETPRRPRAGLSVVVTTTGYEVSASGVDLGDPRFGDGPVDRVGGLLVRRIEPAGVGADRALYRMVTRIADAVPGDREAHLEGHAGITFGAWTRAAEVIATRRPGASADGRFEDDAAFEKARIPLDRGRPGVGAPLFDRIYGP